MWLSLQSKFALWINTKDTGWKGRSSLKQTRKHRAVALYSPTPTPSASQPGFGVTQLSPKMSTSGAPYVLHTAPPAQSAHPRLCGTRWSSLQFVLHSCWYRLRAFLKEPSVDVLSRGCGCGIWNWGGEFPPYYSNLVHCLVEIGFNIFIHRFSS